MSGKLREIQNKLDELTLAVANITGSGHEWQRNKRRALIESYGGECQNCGSKATLEFAHIAPTGLSGPGRGFSARVEDVMRHPRKYILLCRDCHNNYDHERYHPRRERREHERARETGADDEE